MHAKLHSMNASWRLHDFILRSEPHHSKEAILAALDDLNAITTELETFPALIDAAEANAAAANEASLTTAVTALQTASDAIKTKLTPVAVDNVGNVA